MNNVTQTTPVMTTTSGWGGQNRAVVGTSATLVGGLVLIAILVVVVCLKRKMRNKGSLSHGSVSEFSASASSVNDAEMGKFDRALRRSSMIDSDWQFSYWNEVDPGLKAVLEDLLIDTKRLEISRLIGQGQFGCVYEAALSRQPRTSNDYGDLSHERVAVKTLKGTDLDVMTIEAFLQEGLIMKDFVHKNVLSLLGVALGEGGVPMIILPYMKHGNLKSYIGKPDLVITVRDLLGMAIQVAQGMSYLSAHKFVHRDLAARNCMLNQDMVVMVADFGLSRDIYTKDYYTSSDKQAKLPVKWMAVESLTKSVYTTKSDVWSFGVLMWELLTRGATPYPDVTNWEVREYIQSGRRMQQPETCPDEIFELMLQCWLENPETRPTFDDIVQGLSQVLYPAGVDSPIRPGEDPNYINLRLDVDVPQSPRDDDVFPVFP